MLWLILIVLIIAGIITNNFTPLKIFGKIVACFFGIIFVICLIALIVIRVNAADSKKAEEAYWEQVKKTPLIDWACDVNGYQLYLGERPTNVFHCSTGKQIAHSSGDGYWCDKPFEKVNHWQYCKPNVNTKRSKFNYLRGN